MNAYEKLGSFYLGRQDPTADGEGGGLLLYDSRDLTTHGLCVGMTGSGKTGLCLALIEEAAMDGIPVLAIDPKGDLGNLLLTFPELRPSDFAPWVDPDEAARKGLSPEALAEQTATRWRQGLADWDQDGERIRRLRAQSEFRIYTPGSSAGRPLTVLRSFRAPSAAVRGDVELLAERVDASVSGLLSLLGLQADPLQSREHILLANLLRYAWEAGSDLDLPAILRGIQSPPFDKVGFFDLESFFPSKDRAALAMRLNNLLASPGFSAWLQGDPLEMSSLLYSPEGKPRVSILSIAHLSESERMFFVTLVLNEMISWMREQAGTSSLRAVLYMDEIFGFFPPNANPPAKLPMLTLLKQARAYGIGCLLATQNPVDLDYKGLANTGTWFIGRLQTERDKARVMDGLLGAAGGEGLDRAALDKILSGLGSRRFLLHNVHEPAPVVFETRWVMSYLRGPLTRNQIRQLDPATPPPQPAPVVAPPPPAPTPAATTVKESGVMAPPEIPQRVLHASGEAACLRPGIGGVAKLHYVRVSAGVDLWREKGFWVPFENGETNWSGLLWLEEGRELEPLTEEGLPRDPLPAAAGNARSYAAWQKHALSLLYENAQWIQFACPQLKLRSEAEESRSSFQARVQLAAREVRDREVEALRDKYQKQAAMLQDRIRRAEDRVNRNASAHQEKKLQTALSFGSSLLSAFLGKRRLTATNVSRANTSLRSAGRLGKSKDEITRAQTELQVQMDKLQELEARLEADIQALQTRLDGAGAEVTELSIPFRKTDARFSFFGLLWRAE